MDDISKYRLTGAAIWLGLLVVIVPSWYNNPVDFKPEGGLEVEVSAERPLVAHIYSLPEQGQVPVIRPTLNSGGDKKALISPSFVKPITAKQHAAEGANDKQWIVRIISFKEINNANDLLGKLEEEYDVYIKKFERTGTYSVRVGPYASEDEAKKDSRKLDKLLHTQSEVVSLN